MSEQLLDRPNIVTRGEQMRREGVAERVTAHQARDPDVPDRLTDSTLDDCLVQMMAAFDLRPRIAAPMLGRKRIASPHSLSAAGYLRARRPRHPPE